MVFALFQAESSHQFQAKCSIHCKKSLSSQKNEEARRMFGIDCHNRKSSSFSTSIQSIRRKLGQSLTSRSPSPSRLLSATARNRRSDLYEAVIVVGISFIDKIVSHEISLCITRTSTYNIIIIESFGPGSAGLALARG